MTGLERRLRAAAARLIDRHGKAATLRRTVRSFDPATGETGETVTDSPVTASPPESFDLRRIDGTLVRAGDAVISLAAEGLAVEPAAETDSVILDGASWTIVQVSRRFAGEAPVLYTLHLRS